ncbi:MAG TPA: hypothetical protein VL997_00875 [Dyella sp.]|nr:hypothetical protein [Dyella sp.]
MFSIKNHIGVHMGSDVHTGTKKSGGGDDRGSTKTAPASITTSGNAFPASAATGKPTGLLGRFSVSDPYTAITLPGDSTTYFVKGTSKTSRPQALYTQDSQTGVFKQTSKQAMADGRGVWKLASGLPAGAPPAPVDKGQPGSAASSSASAVSGGSSAAGDANADLNQVLDDISTYHDLNLGLVDPDKPPTVSVSGVSGGAASSSSTSTATASQASSLPAPQASTSSASASGVASSSGAPAATAWPSTASSSSAPIATTSRGSAGTAAHVSLDVQMAQKGASVGRKLRTKILLRRYHAVFQFHGKQLPTVRSTPRNTSVALENRNYVSEAVKLILQRSGYRVVDDCTAIYSRDLLLVSDAATGKRFNIYPKISTDGKCQLPLHFSKNASSLLAVVTINPLDHRSLDSLYLIPLTP